MTTVNPRQAALKSFNCDNNESSRRSLIVFVLWSLLFSQGYRRRRTLLRSLMWWRLEIRQRASIDNLLSCMIASHNRLCIFSSFQKWTQHARRCHAYRAAQMTTASRRYFRLLASHFRCWLQFTQRCVKVILCCLIMEMFLGIKDCANVTAIADNCVSAALAALPASSNSAMLGTNNTESRFA